MIETGQLAPSISLMTDQGQFILSEHIGKNVIIFFFESRHLRLYQRSDCFFRPSGRI